MLKEHVKTEVCVTFVIAESIRTSPSALPPLALLLPPIAVLKSLDYLYHHNVMLFEFYGNDDSSVRC